MQCISVSVLLTFIGVFMGFGMGMWFMESRDDDFWDDDDDDADFV